MNLRLQTKRAFPSQQNFTTVLELVFPDINTSLSSSTIQVEKIILDADPPTSGTVTRSSVSTIIIAGLADVTTRPISIYYHLKRQGSQQWSDLSIQSILKGASNTTLNLTGFDGQYILEYWFFDAVFNQSPPLQYACTLNQVSVDCIYEPGFIADTYYVGTGNKNTGKVNCSVFGFINS